MSQERIQKQSKTSVEEVQPEETSAAAVNEGLAESTEATLDNIDDALGDFADEDLLADLDDVLGTEEEAEQMIAGYIQQGGE